MQRRILLLVLLALASGSGGCQSEHPAPGSGSPLCASCLPQAGGETSDFGARCRLAPIRPLTEEDERHYGLDRVRELLRDEVRARIGWLRVSHQRSDRASSTPESTLTARFEITGTSIEDRLMEDDPCGPAIRVRMDAELATTDGALQAELSGDAYRAEDGVWHASFVSDLTSARGFVDLHLSEAWQEVRGAGAREGELELHVRFDEGEVSGEIFATVGYATYPGGISVQDGESGRLSKPRARSPIEGRFPLTRCSLRRLPRGTPIAPDVPLPEANGKTAAMLVQEAQALLGQGCRESWSAEWRGGDPAEFILELDQASELALCWTYREGEISGLSWSAVGSLSTRDGRLRGVVDEAFADVARGRITGVGVATAAQVGRPEGAASCLLESEQPDQAGTWHGVLELPGKQGVRDCVESPVDPNRLPNTGKCVLAPPKQPWEL